jgi:hypothetical protein
MGIYHRYEDALIAKLRIHEWYQSYQGQNYLREFFTEMNSKHTPDERLDEGGLVYLQRQMIERAEPVYVSMDVADIIDHARWSWKAEELMPGDPFVPSGFAILPKPIYLEDNPENADKPGSYKEGVPVRAISWLPMHTEDLSAGCVWIAFYVHVDDDPTDRWNFEEKAEIRRLSPLMIGHQWQWTWGRNPEQTPALSYDGETEEQGSLRAWQQAALIQTFWRIGQQIVPVKERAPRGLWRDSKRKGVEHRDIKILLLRRGRDNHEYEPTGRQMRVRSITSGHWKNQPYGRKGEEKYYRQIWINPYMRGPENAPLILPERGIEFKR